MKKTLQGARGPGGLLRRGNLQDLFPAGEKGIVGGSSVLGLAHPARGLPSTEVGGSQGVGRWRSDRPGLLLVRSSGWRSGLENWGWESADPS